MKQEEMRCLSCVSPILPEFPGVWNFHVLGVIPELLVSSEKMQKNKKIQKDISKAIFVSQAEERILKERWWQEGWVRKSSKETRFCGTRLPQNPELGGTFMCVTKPEFVLFLMLFLSYQPNRQNYQLNLQVYL